MRSWLQIAYVRARMYLGGQLGCVEGQCSLLSMQALVQVADQEVLLPHGGFHALCVGLCRKGGPVTAHDSELHGRRRCCSCSMGACCQLGTCIDTIGHRVGIVMQVSTSDSS